jgi:hypothetical protein
MRHDPRVHGDVLASEYARISALLRLYDFDRDDSHVSTVVSRVRSYANDIA